MTEATKAAIKIIMAYRDAPGVLFDRSDIAKGYIRAANDIIAHLKANPLDVPDASKPSWDNAPERARWLAQDTNGRWFWCEKDPGATAADRGQAGLGGLFVAVESSVQGESDD